jgi:thioredoxin-related protein
MTYRIFIVLLLVITTSCNNTETSTKTVEKDTTKAIDNKIMIPSASCYAAITGKDTILLKVEIFEHVVTGHLVYKLYEKDSNTGNFEGQLKGDTLIADYTFRSEGSTSTRQLVFLLQDSVAIEGYGAIKEKNGRMIFKNTSAADFSKGTRLKKVDCNK